MVWDEQPCYVRHPATAPEAFLGPAPVAARLADAAAARAFLEGVEPEPGHHESFRVASVALLDRLEHDLEAGEVDPDWEVLLWRLLRAFLPLVDPQWVAAHQLEPEVLPEEFLERERRQVESLECQLAEARPGLVGERPPGAMVKLLAAPGTALWVYQRGRCSLGPQEMQAVREAYVRYVERDRG